MAYALVRNHRWGIGFRFRGVEVFPYIGLDDGSLENKRIARARAKDVTHKVAAGTFDFAKEFPNALAYLKRFGLLPKPATAIPTLGDYCLQLLEHWPARNLELTPAVLYDYELVIKGHVLSHKIADMPINEILEGDIRALAKDLQKKTGTRRINYTLARLRTVFKTAAREKLTADNPMIDVHDLRQARPEIDPFDAAEVTAILDAAKGWEHAFLTILLHRGLRPNEALALKWRDVDWRAGTLKIRGTVHRPRHGGITLPKTPGSERTIQMGPHITGALQSQRSHRRRLKVVQIEGNGDDLIFPSEKGTPIDLGNFRMRNWQRILNRASVRPRDLYQCRHTFACLALDAGATVREVADMLGHTSVDMVVSRYAKPTRNASSTNAAGSAFDRAIVEARHNNAPVKEHGAVGD